MKIKIINPKNKLPLNLRDGNLVDEEGNEFSITNGVPRIAKLENYTENFGVQWNKFDKTQLDSEGNGLSLSKARFFSETGWDQASLDGLNILEVGSGAGRFSRVVLEHTDALLYSVDYSDAVTANYKKAEKMKDKRNYNTEILDTADHQYAYCFDLDVMHPYMIRSFQPFFRPGSLLELGSYKGDFTKRFLQHFNDVTCVEASSEAMAEARCKLGDGVQYVNSLFEEAALSNPYDNIVLTHVLEHLDNPVRVLRRINDEWLAEGGRFFLVCPNANAPSRQIAVKMGLISHNTAVTPAEAEHGHRRTYTLDTLERDAVTAGLKVVYRSGIFFKALANFQWDRLLKTDIISKEYLEGCYQLGQQYPDLCSSIFLLCERGNS